MKSVWVIYVYHCMTLTLTLWPLIILMSDQEYLNILNHSHFVPLPFKMRAGKQWFQSTFVLVFCFSVHDMSFKSILFHSETWNMYVAGKRPMTTQPRSRKEDTSPVNRAVSAPARGKNSPSIIVSRSNDDSRPSTAMTRPSTGVTRPHSGETTKSARLGAPTPDHSHLKSRLKTWKEEKWASVGNKILPQWLPIVVSINRQKNPHFSLVSLQGNWPAELQ